MATIYDFQTEFSGDLSAKLIAGANDTNNKEDAYRVVLKLLRDAYQSARSHYQEINDAEGNEPWSIRQPQPVSAIQSTAMLACERILERDPLGQTFSAWLAGSSSSFDGQTFDRVELQRWIDAVKLPSEYLFGVGADQAQINGQPTRDEEIQIDFSILCTRQQLVDAFGPFTGLDISWFNNLKDSPKLKDARKHVGQGGKGHTVEPMFCPYLVMQWLVDPKRRKGKPMNTDTGWRMLETHFRKAYNIYSIGDSRTD